MKIIHLVSIPDKGSKNDLRRYSIAKKTWHNLLDHGVIPCYIEDNQLPRNSKTSFGDSRPLPFIRDIFDIGIKQHNPDVIIFNNADTCIFSDFIYKVSDRIIKLPALCGKRIDMQKIDGELPIGEIKGKEEMYGYDIFILKRQWIDNYWDYMPDMVLGSYKWDIILSDLILTTVPNSEIKNLCYHELHDVFWSKASNINNNPAQKHNYLISKHIYSKLRILRNVAGIVRGEFQENGAAIGAINHELKDIYRREKNLLTEFV